MKISFHNNLYTGKYGFLAQIIVMTFASILADWVLPGVKFDSVTAAILTALVISLLNTFIRPILIVIALPFVFLSMGLFLLIINAIVVWIASGMVASFHVDGFGNVLLFSLLLTLFNYLLEIPNRNMRRPKFSGSDKTSDSYTSYRPLNDENSFQECEEVENDND